MLFIRLQSDPVEIYTVKRIHTYQSTLEDKTFRTDFLISDNEHVLTMASAYQSLVLVGEEKTPMNLDHLDYVGTLDKGTKTYHKYTITFSLPYFTPNLTLDQSDATLRITLQNDAIYDLPIGPFSYQTLPHEPSALTLSKVHNIFGSTGQGVTSKGIYLTVVNDYENPIYIKDISIGSKAARVNPYLITKTNKPFDIDYDLTSYISHENDTPLRIAEQTTVNVAMPLEKTTPYTLLYRYPILVTYRVEGSVKQKILDDFLFINTTPYVEENSFEFIPVTPYVED